MSNEHISQTDDQMVEVRRALLSGTPLATEKEAQEHVDQYGAVASALLVGSPLLTDNRTLEDLTNILMGPGN